MLFLTVQGFTQPYGFKRDNVWEAFSLFFLNIVLAILTASDDPPTRTQVRSTQLCRVCVWVCGCVEGGVIILNPGVGCMERGRGHHRQCGAVRPYSARAAATIQGECLVPWNDEVLPVDRSSLPLPSYTHHSVVLRAINHSLTSTIRLSRCFQGCGDCVSRQGTSCAT